MHRAGGHPVRVTVTSLTRNGAAAHVDVRIYGPLPPYGFAAAAPGPAGRRLATGRRLGRSARRSPVTGRFRPRRSLSGRPATAGDVESRGSGNPEVTAGPARVVAEHREDGMARRHRLIKAGPEEVWAVLADGGRYAEWVVGTASSEPVRGRWPAVGAAIGYEVRLGPLRLANETVVRRLVAGSVLELEAHAGALGTARIALEVHPWGEYALVTVDEHPLRGTAGALHNAGAEMLIQLRHRTMLARLARICESESGAGAGASREAASGAARGSGEPGTRV